MAMKDVVEKVQSLIDELSAAAEKEGCKLVRTQNVSAAKRLRAALLKTSKECKEIRKSIMEEIKSTQLDRSTNRSEDE